MTDEQDLLMTSKETALNNISRLVERFDRQYDSYKHSTYNETLTRRDFIDPFFKALGWDMDNENGYAEAYREVIHEDRVKISGYMKAPDYSFRLVGGKRLFFVEAKKPSVYVKGDILPAYQVRRYGWSAKLPVSIITDFEEFSIYDCTKKPDPKDSASVARTNYLTFREYVNEFDFIYDTFSKENVLRGSFDKFIQGNTGKKGTATVDKEFLLSLDKWRTYLAKAISKENKNLNEDEINFAVQQFIDRIIFLRIAEDRNVEPYGSLKETLSCTGNIYKNLFRLFKTADEKYNSGIFDFKKDRISEGLTLDNKVIKTIISELYYPESPYEFSVLSVEILGSAYEQFLGKQIRISNAHRVTIEDKPEVRKAGGVYYTPQYIVDYIVKNTVGKLIEKQPDGKAGKTPKEISKIKIVDPACGSGSFLLGAYQYLLDYHKDYYSQNGKIKNNIKRSGKNTKEDTVLTPEGNLTTAEKKRILTNNIFGVDIDTNAVEVTKLSLLLKCMEGETDASIATQTKLWNERVLPNIDSNIKSGNSLIDTDFYDGELDFGDEKKIKPFNWQKAFPEVFAQGGFDAVIGNPPYRMMQPKDTDEEILKYFKKHYIVAEFKIDLFHLFIRKGLQLNREKGLLGFIAPSSLLNNVYAENLRKWILNNTLIKIISLTKEKVFPDADVYTAVYIFEKHSNSKNILSHNVQTTIELELLKSNSELKYSITNQKRFFSFEGTVWNILLNENNANIIEKIKYKTSKLSSIAEINRGLITGDRNKYFSKVCKNNKYKSIFSGSDIHRYNVNYVSEYVYFEKPKGSGGCWDEDVHFAKHKILIRQIGFTPTATIIEKPIAVTGNIFTVRSKDLEFEKYILAIINSKMIKYYWKIMFADFKNSFPQVSIFSLNSIPIKENPDIIIFQEIVKHVDQLLKLNSEKQTVKLQSKIEQIQSRIDYCEDKIDRAVYELYGLTEDEIKVVEGKS
ncbi:MAG: N-6 DNA methylase [Bacteroidetes bacterium]|nr:N-6 DNA methylase [Bacteroidota bacterium]